MLSLLKGLIYVLADFLGYQIFSTWMGAHIFGYIIDGALIYDQFFVICLTILRNFLLTFEFKMALGLFLRWALIGDLHL